MRMLTLLLLLCVPAAAADRLNVLFVFADDWGRYASAYGKIDGQPSLNEVISTPNVDRLAREGVLFRRAFVNSPSCTPCRSSLLSGRYFFNTGQGAILNGAVWDASIPSYPLLLRDAGYHIGKSYKVWSPGTPADAPFGEQRHAYEQAGKAPNNVSEETEKLLAQGLSVSQAHSRILDQVRGNFDAFLAARNPDQPWLYQFGTTTTHRAWIKGSGKSHWGIDPDRLKGKMPGFLPDVAEIREDVADYLGECQAVDACLGVLIAKLEAIGELERTVIVASGDHGMPGVPHGKCNLYDHGTSVTLAIRFPGGTPGRVIDDIVRIPDLCPTFLEIAGVAPPPNLYGRSLLPILKSGAQGRVDPTRDWAILGRERHVASAREGNLPYPMRALRKPDFLYIRNFEPDRWPMGTPAEGTEAGLENETRAGYADMDASPTKAWIVAHREDPEWKPYFDRALGKRPSEELYDLTKDPDQIVNVADHPEYAAKKRELSAELMTRLEAAGDPRLTADPVFEHAPFTNSEPSPKKKPRAKPTR